MNARGKLSRIVALAAAIGIGMIGAISVTDPAHAAQMRGRFVFNKNSSDPTNSTLTYYEEDLSRPQGPVVISSKKWRAGSGDGVTTNTCTSNHGWLPTGSYGGRLHMEYDGSLIKGVAFQLDDKKCNGGSTVRSELFIHSEMNRDGSQGTSEARRWDGNSDFKSNGCVKLRPDDIKNAASLFKEHRTAGTYYADLLTVVA
jgi:hypothetical protein